jgi:hypothetical protein
MMIVSDRLGSLTVWVRQQRSKTTISAATLRISGTLIAFDNVVTAMPSAKA